MNVREELEKAISASIEITANYDMDRDTSIFWFARRLLENQTLMMRILLENECSLNDNGY